jgi:hypothetical protein
MTHAILNPEETKSLIMTLRARFEKNMDLHAGIEWDMIQSKLEANPAKLASISQMESTGGEPDVIGYDSATETYLYVDCSVESPT